MGLYVFSVTNMSGAGLHLTLDRLLTSFHHQSKVASKVAGALAWSSHLASQPSPAAHQTWPGSAAPRTGPAKSEKRGRPSTVRTRRALSGLSLNGLGLGSSTLACDLLAQSKGLLRLKK